MRFYIIYSFLICITAPLMAQNTPVKSITRDTLLFHRASLRLQHEVAKRGELNLDSLRIFGNAAIKEGKTIHFKEGIIRTYLDVGAGYIAKALVDSAKFYYLLGIDQAVALKDTHLLALAYSGLGWTLVYDGSDYEGAIQNSLKATALAEASNDTTLYIHVATRLVKVYFLASKLMEAFQLCTEMQHVCEIQKDTSAQINNYYMFGSIYGRMNLFDKQMDMVHKAQELNNNKNDTSFLYIINLTASNSYLFKQQYDSVLYYSRRNVAYCAHLNLMPNCYSNIAKAFLETGQLDSARYYYTLIMDYHHANGTYVDTYLYLDQGRIEYLSGHKAKALEYYKKAEVDISKPALSTQTEIYKALYEYYEAAGNTKATLFYLKKYKTWSDSLASEEYAMRVLKYDFASLKEQNQRLLTEKEFQTLLAEKQRNEKNLALGGTIFLLLLTVLGFEWLRRQRTLKNKQILLAERLRISRELHDEVGATLSGIAMYSHVAVEQLRNSKWKDVEHSLSSMQKSAGEMVIQLSDIVWLINPNQDTILELFGRLGEYGKQMTRVKNMQMRIDLSPDLSAKHIPLDARRNIYLFCKEAINNAVKYSNGTTLVLQAKSIGQQMIISVTDDGNGFDESIIKQGNGWVNMQKRAKAIGAEFHKDTRINQGTRIELQYKIIQ